MKEQIAIVVVVVALFGGAIVLSEVSEARAAGDAEAWTLTRCEDSWGTVCFMASSGMLACRFE